MTCGSLPKASLDLPVNLDGWKEHSLPFNTDVINPADVPSCTEESEGFYSNPTEKKIHCLKQQKQMQFIEI